MAKGHQRADSEYRVFQHILVFESHYKCCVLEWGDVHHKNGIKTDNKIENLQGLTHSKHSQLTHLMDLSKRVCSRCGTNKTVLVKQKIGMRPNWFTDKKTGLKICKRCYAYDAYRTGTMSTVR